MNSPPPNRWLRRLFAVLLGLLGGFALAEAGIRVLLFNDTPGIVRFSGRLREAKRWANQRNDDLFWELSFRWANKKRLRVAPNCPDPLLGWVRHEVQPESYEHSRTSELNGRRPVLLYGDSFAQGMTGPKGTFTRLMEESDLGGSHALVNYGTGGHGVDQAYLLAKNSVAHFEDAKPLVIFSVLVDDDLDRAAIGFRSWPKPRLRVESEQLTVTPPETSDGSVYQERHPPTAFSWTWQYLLNKKGALSPQLQARLRGDDEYTREKQALFTAMMKDLKAEFEAKDIEWFVLVFVGEHGLVSPRPRDWREPFVVQALEELEIPHVNTRADVYAFASEHGLKIKDLFITKGRGRNHHNMLGNIACLQTFMRGIEGDFDPYEYVPGKLSKPPKRAAPEAAEPE